VGQALQVIAQLVPVRSAESWAAALRRVSRRIRERAGLAGRDRGRISVPPVSDQWLWEQQRTASRQGDNV
jgi:hypothetical protein